MPEPDELTQRERDEMAALPRYREPGRLLEERTVRELRARGLLRKPGVHRAWWAAAAAAAVALFATGFALGQRSASAAGVAMVTATVESQQAAMQAALQVQRTGSAWIAALTSLASLEESGDPDALRQGREAARSALRAAVVEYASMAPSDAVASQMLWLLSDTGSGGTDSLPAARQSQAFVWF